MRTAIVLTIMSGPFSLINGCAGPMGPPLDLGPGLDQMALVVIVVGAIVFLYRPLRKRLSPRPTSIFSNQAENTARDRYARGELTREEYTRIIEDLRVR